MVVTKIGRKAIRKTIFIISFIQFSILPSLIWGCFWGGCWRVWVFFGGVFFGAWGCLGICLEWFENVFRSKKSYKNQPKHMLKPIHTLNHTYFAGTVVSKSRILYVFKSVFLVIICFIYSLTIITRRTGNPHQLSADPVHPSS